MASILKRKYWVDASGKPVRKGTPGATERESRRWSILYTNAHGRTQRKAGYVDKRATEQLAARLEKHVAHGNEGLLDPFAEHKKRPLLDHLTDYLADLEAKGRDDLYRANLRSRIKRVLEANGWDYFGQISAEEMTSWMRKYLGTTNRPGLRRGRGISGAAVNQHLESMNAFFNWCAHPHRKRFPNNPLLGVEKLQHEAVFERRALSAEQVAALMTKAPKDRASVYIFAVSTGLRRQEIEDLQWGDVVLDGPTAFIKLRILANKSRRADTAPLRDDVADMLRRRRPADWEATGKVFSAVPSVEVYREDLAAAGVEVPPVGSKDQIDFHGLRTTLGTLMALAGTNPRVAMEVMRHTDMRLTQRVYTDPKVFDTKAVVNGLPIAANPAPQAQEMRATGTDGKAEPPKMGKKLAQTERRNSPGAAASRQDEDGGEVLQAAAVEELMPRLAATGHVSPDRGKAGGLGFEPRQAESESAVLPLHHPPVAV